MNDREHKCAVWNELLIDQRDENHDIRTELKHVRAANICLVDSNAGLEMELAEAGENLDKVVAVNDGLRDANTRLQEDKEALTGEVKKLTARIDRLQQEGRDWMSLIVTGGDQLRDARRWSAAWKRAAKKHRQQALYWYFWGQRILSHYKKAQAALTRYQDARLLHDIARLEDQPAPETCPECDSGTWTIGARTLCIDCGWAELAQP
jgi:hypothetical protein